MRKILLLPRRMKKSLNEIPSQPDREISGEQWGIEEHLAELRWRLFVALVGVGLASLISYHYREFLLELFARPVTGLVFLRPAEAFFAYLKIAFFGGFFLALPLVLYQVWRFVLNGLTWGEYRQLRWLLPFSYLLFLGGALFALVVIIPLGMRFLLAFQGPQLTPFISVSAYLNFVFFLSIGTGIIFQLPLVLLFLTRLGLVDPGYLARKRPVAIVVILIIAAFLSPGPDVVTQMLLAIPLYILYELSLGIAFLAGTSFSKIRREDE